MVVLLILVFVAVLMMAMFAGPNYYRRGRRIVIERERPVIIEREVERPVVIEREVERPVVIEREYEA